MRVQHAGGACTRVPPPPPGLPTQPGSLADTPTCPAAEAPTCPTAQVTPAHRGCSVPGRAGWRDQPPGAPRPPAARPRAPAAAGTAAGSPAPRGRPPRLVRFGGRAGVGRSGRAAVLPPARHMSCASRCSPRSLAQGAPRLGAAPRTSRQPPNPPTCHDGLTSKHLAAFRPQPRPPTADPPATMGSGWRRSASAHSTRAWMPAGSSNRMRTETERGSRSTARWSAGEGAGR